VVETYDIRLFSKYLSLINEADQIPQRPGYVSVTVRGTVGDPLFVRIGELDQRLRKSGLGFAFGGWEIQRSYSEEELARAQLFLLKVPFTEFPRKSMARNTRSRRSVSRRQTFWNTWVGQTFASFCALCSTQIGPLRIAFRKLRRNLDVYRLWGGELIVSERFTSLINKGGFSGGAFFPISDATDDDLTSPLEFSDSPAGLEVLSSAADKQMSPGDWAFWRWLNSEAQKALLERMLAQKKSAAKGNEGTGSRRNLAQLVLRSKPLAVSEQSRFGATPFDTDTKDYHQCDAGVIAGRRLISPLSVLRSSWDRSDLCRTDVYVAGQRQGLFRPYQLFVVSKKLLEALQHQGMKGFQFEVVGMV